jgi:hypothetical protein
MILQKGTKVPIVIVFITDLTYKIRENLRLIRDNPRSDY